MSSYLSNCDERNDIPWTVGEIRERIGINSESLIKDRAFGENEIERMSISGIRRLELHPLHYAYCKDKQYEEIIRACKNNGIEIVSVHLPICPFASKSEKERKRAVKEGTAAATLGYRIGAKIAVIHLGVSDQSKVSVLEMIDNLHGIPIRLAIENLEENDFESIVRFIDGIGQSRLGMTLDIGHPKDEDGINPFCKKDKAREIINLCGEKITHVHLHDIHIIDHVPPFTGNIQWEEVFRGLRDIDYKGTFLFEYIHQNGVPQPDPALIDSESIKYYLWNRDRVKRNRMVAKNKSTSIPSKVELKRLIKRTPLETVQKALKIIPDKNSTIKIDQKLSDTPEKKLGEYLNMILKAGGNEIIRYAVGAGTEELLRATAEFPQKLLERYYNVRVENHHGFM